MKFFIAVVLYVKCVAGVTVTVAGAGGVPASPLQYGIMFEDINHSGDGGIYAELIQNRAFQGDALTAPSLKPWTAFGGAVLALQSTSPPLSSALPRSVSVKGTAGAEIGLSNPGYWGIDVQVQTYTGSFHVLGDYSGTFTAALRARGGTILASASIPSKSMAGSWTKHHYFIVSNSSVKGAGAVFTLTWTPSDNAQSLNFNLVSLSPPTYNNHGLRKDLMQALAALKPSFLRLPGGNNIEGEKAGANWQWSKTVGDLTQRPGRTGDWGYYNTDGLGLIEYMLWCQDLGMEPILAFFSGLYLDKTTVSQAKLGTYIQDALDELEFLMGDASTTHGAQRIALGYKEPFRINYVEIGNEDNLNNGQSSYNSYRFKAFYDAINAKYPDMHIIASTTTVSSLPGGAASDYHEYSTPDKMATQFTLFDRYSTTHKTLVGEYAVTQPQKAQGADTDWGLPFKPYPWFVGAVAEAIFEIGAEKNADKIIGLSYAPLLMNTNDMRWKPDLIAFNADASQTTLSTSYQRIKLFSNNRATTVLPVKNSAPYGPAFWVAGINNNTQTYTFKAAVYNTTANQDFAVVFPGAQAGVLATLTVLTAPSGPYAMNKPGQPEVLDTHVSTLVATKNGFEFSLPQWAIALLTWTP